MPEIINTSKVDLGYVAESTPGTTPATPAWQKLPITGGGPVGGVTKAASQTIRSDRQKSDLITVDQDVTGDVNFELSYEAYKPLLQSLMMGSPMNGFTTQTDVAVSATGKTFTSASAADFSNIPAGAYIRVSGATNPGNNGLFRVVTATTLVITVHDQDAAGLVDESAGASIKIERYHVPNGTLDIDYYSFMKKVALAIPVYMYYRGCAVNSLNLSVTTGSIVTGSIGILGLTEEVTTSAIAGQSEVGYTSFRLLNSVDSVAVTSSGLESDVQIESATLSYSNNIQAAKAVGTLGAVALSAGTISATGNVTLYFEDKTAYDLFKNDTGFSLAFKFSDSDGNDMVVFMPQVRFSTMETPIQGQDAFFLIDASYEAIMDPTLGFTIALAMFDAP